MCATARSNPQWIIPHTALLAPQGLDHSGASSALSTPSDCWLTASSGTRYAPPKHAKNHENPSDPHGMIEEAIKSPRR